MRLWPKAPAVANNETVTPAWMPLRVVSRGMCCAVGYSAAAATAAINSRLNHFRETEFVARGGEKIVGGALFELDTWGADRLNYLLKSVINETLAGETFVDTARIAILVLGAEPTRPGVASECLADALTDILEEAQQRGKGFHPATRFLDYGKAGVGKALAHASQLLTSNDAPEYVLLAAVDSLLDAVAVERFLDEERIATKTNSDGFIPGEGAGAVLLTKAVTAGPSLCIEAVASAHEEWRFQSDLPVRAQGLTTAIREAAQKADLQIASLDFHASGMTGESWYSKEVGLALARCMERKKPEFPHLMVARSIGETGAASPLLTLAWLAGVMGQGHYQPGCSGLLHFAADDGQRTALIVRYIENSHVTR